MLLSLFVFLMILRLFIKSCLNFGGFPFHARCARFFQFISVNMATKKTSSSISFNTMPFLETTLNNAVSEGLIYFFAFIRHYPEEDTKKEHYHLFIAPSKPLDLISFRRLFIEPVSGYKPLCCLPFQPSKIGDWLLYALHDISYLNKKGLVRLNHYSIESVVTNDDEYLLQSYYDAKETYNDTRMNLFIRELRQGASFGDILRSGIVPPNQIVYWEKVYKSSMVLFGKDVDNKQVDLIPQPI